MERIVILSDQQARFHDKHTIASVERFIGSFEPDIIVNNGDLFDFEALSTFRKTLDGKASLMADAFAGVKMLAEQRALCPNARIILVEGNHEERLRRYVLDNAEALSDLPSLTVPAFLELDKWNIEYIGPYGAGFDWHSVLVYHGERVNVHSAYTAHAELQSAGTSGVSGHTHRLGSYYRTDRGGTHVWLENGCLCNTTGSKVPPGVKGLVQNWQQGFSVGFYSTHPKHWTLYQVPIVNHKFIWDGRLYQ